jgi:hypothetical protein
MNWPTESQCPKFYGPIKEIDKHLGFFIPPYPMVLSWDKKAKVTKVVCHELVADSFLTIFLKVKSAYSPNKIKDLGLDLFGGCFNVRLKRGSKTSWSIHSWGCAIDLDDARNGLRVKRPNARLSKTDAEEFWKIVESVGGVSLGRQRNFDWMHYQFARL